MNQILLCSSQCQGRCETENANSQAKAGFPQNTLIPEVARGNLPSTEIKNIGLVIKFSLWKHQANPNTANITYRVQGLFNPPLPKGFGAIAALTHPVFDAFLILRERWSFCLDLEHSLVPMKGAQQPVMPEAAHLAGSMGIISLLWIPGIQLFSKQCPCKARPLRVPAGHWAGLDVPRGIALLLSHTAPHFSSSLFQLIRDFHLTWTNLTKIFTKS